MTSPETRTQPFDMADEPPRQRRGSMVDDAMASPFGDMREGRRGSDGSDEMMPIGKRDRRMSKEWDASKTPPSRFQKVEGSIFATPSSRDGHVARNKIHGFKEKVKELAGKK